MKHTSGNYQAFLQATKPENTDKKNIYFVGAGLASLAAAVFLIRDVGIKGKNILIYEQLDLPGGSLDAKKDPARGFVMRGGREMEEHFETLWDLFRSIPSLEQKNMSILDEFAEINRRDPSFSYTRMIANRGQQVADDGQLTLTEKSIKEIMHLCLMTEKELNDVKINDVFSKDFFDSNFWWYWASMFAFEPWHSAMEMRRYLLRFVHHIETLSNMSALRFTQYHQYESLVKPLMHYLEGHGVRFQYNTQVNNIIVNPLASSKMAKQIQLTVDGKSQSVDLTENDLVFVTNGSITESTNYGDNTHPASVQHELGGSWSLWKNMAAQDAAFGRPEKFCDNIPKANWTISATITLSDDKALPYIEKISKKDPHSGSIVTSGPVVIKDSNWMYGYSISRQPVFKEQKPNETIVWVYGLFSDRPGNFIKKTITECTGIELCQEWLYHIGVPEADIVDIATNSANTVIAYMPYISTYFMPRAVGDRPQVVPDGYKNLAFIGNYAETPSDTVFTTEYSVRTAMEAVYTLFDVKRGVPEVFASSFDVRRLLKTIYYLNDQKNLSQLELPLKEAMMEKYLLHKIKGSYIEELLKDERLI